MPVSELNDKLEKSKQQLMYTSLFVDVDVHAIRVDSAHAFINVHVKERWYLFPIPYFKIVSRNFNTWWYEENRSLSRTEYGLKFIQNNATGRNDNLNLWFIGGFTQQISLRYDNPSIGNKLQHGFNIGFGMKRNRELNYGMDTLKPNKWGWFKQEDRFVVKQTYADFSYTYRPAIRTRHSLRASYGNISIEDTVAKLNPSYFASSVKNIQYVDLSYHLSYINVDYIPYPLKGVYGEVNLYKRFGRFSNFWQMTARGNYSFLLSPKSSLQLQAVGLIRLPFDQPYISNHFLGSSDFYMRGLEYYVVQGSAGGVGRATLKHELFAFNVKNPIKSKSHDKIPFRLFVKAYGDAGYSYTTNPGISLLNNKLLRTWGAGIDIITFYDVVLRFEYSFNQLGEHGMFFHNQSDW
jgi:hypothetical protein